MLETAIEKLQFDPNDSLKVSFLKGVGIGALEGLVIVGAVHVIANVTGLKLTK